jgi:tetratricopeptide (TPR) repeat protein
MHLRYSFARVAAHESSKALAVLLSRVALSPRSGTINTPLQTSRAALAPAVQRDGRRGSDHLAPREMDAARMNCYAAFAQAQELENEGDNDAALAAYTELVRAARAAHSSALTYDEKSGPGTSAEIIDSVPPTALVVSVALNSLGGLLLDARKLSEASVAFEDSLSVWSANGMALINLGDLEREHGDFETGLAHYQKA